MPGARSFSGSASRTSQSPASGCGSASPPPWACGAIATSMAVPAAVSAPSSSRAHLNSNACAQAAWSLPTCAVRRSCNTAESGWLLRSPQKSTRGSAAALDADSPPLASPARAAIRSRMRCTSCRRQNTWSNRMCIAAGWKNKCVFAITNSSPLCLCRTALSWNTVVMFGSTDVTKPGHFDATSLKIPACAASLWNTSLKKACVSSTMSNASLRTSMAHPSETWLFFKETRT
mmetsp:Transcript_11899/g.32168  ORF Transcript_11899/g.32168 Transcript_11899/m.32168 type:complete len:232 (+) Transcript_11899:151-846(+)